MRGSLEKRFWKYVARGLPDQCWNWKGAIQSDGYGSIYVSRGKTAQAHRVSFKINGGPLGSRKLICHKCNNRKCCNPKHLYAGTHNDNKKDSINAGTAWTGRGEENGRAKLSANNVKAILRSNLKNTTLAKRFGVTPSLICAIRKGRVWKTIQ